MGRGAFGFFFVFDTEKRALYCTLNAHYCAIPPSQPPFPLLPTILRNIFPPAPATPFPFFIAIEYWQYLVIRAKTRRRGRHSGPLGNLVGRLGNPRNRPFGRSLQW